MLRMKNFVGMRRKETTVACLVEGITKLISERPAADRSALASGGIKDRSQLEVDNTPLRDFYIGGKDKTLLDLLTTYFSVVEKLLWQGQSKGSFITRTVGVLALFDVLRDALKEKAIDIKDMEGSSRVFFKKAQGINFGDDFFHASGAGRVRIRNVLKALVGLPSKPDLAVDEAVKRLRSTQGAIPMKLVEVKSEISPQLTTGMGV